MMNEIPKANEISPLLLGQPSSSFGEQRQEDEPTQLAGQLKTHAHVGIATDAQTIVNQIKTCMGTGTLALSFACKQGGLVVFSTGMFLIAGWNLFCIHRLCQCLQFITAENLAQSFPSAEHSQVMEGQIQLHSNRPLPPVGTATFGRVAWFAFGQRGLQALDFMMVILLHGIIISYLSASVTFLSDTPFTVGPLLDAAITACVMCIVSIVPDMGHLAHFSAAGLFMLFTTFVVIAGYGYTDLTPSKRDLALPLFPVDLYGFSQWFGVVVFSLGIVPLTYNYRQSMAKPSHIVMDSAVALLFVTFTYLFIGIGLLNLFPDLTGDVLHELPEGILPVVVRMAMVVVVATTAPLLVVPCGEIIEGKWGIRSQVLSRAGICAVCAMIAVLLPSFVQVLSIVGCACVGTVSFVLPPLFHWKLSSLQKLESAERQRQPQMNLLSQVVNVCMLILGIGLTMVATGCTLADAMSR